jgi:4-amino-4-deoxy-L-arabinose transferase-like glycosyltransferase
LLLVLAALIIGAGIGLRDPWPADEPRFALVGREMVETGQWLFPHRNGELYPDKPPVFMWMIAACYLATGSLRLAFLLPSLLAGLVTVALVWDLASRLWNRRAAALAGLALLGTLQFVDQARTAQIDAVLAMWTTLAVYGLVRHLLLGPAWPWWYVAFAAMGAGVITKGVGFLPVLLLLPWGFARRRGWYGVPRFRVPWWHAVLGPLTMLAVIGAWLVPMVLTVAASGDPQLAAYRDNILLKQTGERYAAAWHHVRWPGYYLVQVVPWAWLLPTLGLPWLLPAWRRRLARRDGRLLVLFGWAALVLLFFSASPGKRGVYILPAAPALVLAAAPLLPGLVRKAPARRLALACVVIASLALASLAAAGWLAPPRALLAVAAKNEFDLRVMLTPLAFLGLAGLVAAGLGRRHGPSALFAFSVVAWLVVGWWIYPLLNEVRYPRRFMERVEAVAGAGAELGQVNWREQFVLATDRPLRTFGYARRDVEAESREAAVWLAAGARRRLLVPRTQMAPCFAVPRAEHLGFRHGRDWYLVPPAGIEAVCRPAGGAEASR